MFGVSYRDVAGPCITEWQQIQFPGNAGGDLSQQQTVQGCYVHSGKSVPSFLPPER